MQISENCLAWVKNDFKSYSPVKIKKLRKKVRPLRRIKKKQLKIMIIE